MDASVPAHVRCLVVAVPVRDSATGSFRTTWWDQQGACRPASADGTGVRQRCISVKDPL
jgi:hypothetical protein